MEFAVAVFRFCRTLPGTDESRDVVRQLRKASSSVAANCRAAKRSQSDGVFVSKTAVVIEEADESGFWLEFLVEIDLAKRESVRALLRESSELVAIFTASRKSTLARMAAEKARKKAAQRKQ
jgi:four helix bundle protein